ncbi:MAG TPA: hypothetical protein VH597_16155 [Verrucomicrobiae bacterium]|jgi:hypothetical protein|nr:hypothetical protein [Verrucomicrobiae bacterium]
MKTKLFLLCFASAATALAADSPTNSYNFTSRLAPIPITEEMRLQNLLTPKLDLPVIALGKSDFVLSGPLVEGFRRLPPAENLSRGQKFLRLPVIRLFVPKPMPWPEDGGKYFAWHNNSLPWTLASSRPGIQKGPN